MQLVCAVAIEESIQITPGILVLPERTSLAELDAAVSRWPEAIVIGAVKEGSNIRGYALKNGENLIDYRKFASDNLSEGTGIPPRCQTFEDSNVALGVLICKDIQHSSLLSNVMGFLANSRAKLKVVCIPADMDESWFPSRPERAFIGAYVALSNSRRTPLQTRKQSFILDPEGNFLREQSSHEPIAYSAA